MGADRRLFALAASLRNQEMESEGNSYASLLANENIVAPPEGKPNMTWTADSIAAAVQYNLRAHAISMLVRIRAFLIEKGFMSAAAVDQGEKVDVTPEQIVDKAFLEGVAYYQGNRKLGSPDGKIGPGTFGAFEEDGFKYTLDGEDVARSANAGGGRREIIPKNAAPDKMYDYFRDVILQNSGIFSTDAGHMNIVGIRGGKLSDGAVEQVVNEFNKWNDTVAVLWLGKGGEKNVQLFEGTTDPGRRTSSHHIGVATIPEGTHSMEYGWHNPSSGSYRALNPANDGHVPVFRNGESYLGQGTGNGTWLNMHTTHGYDQGNLGGPGGYSLGCTVINGQDQYESFINQMGSASEKEGQDIIYYTVISAGRLDAMVVKSQSPIAHP